MQSSNRRCFALNPLLISKSGGEQLSGGTLFYQNYARHLFATQYELPSAACEYRKHVLCPHSFLKHVEQRVRPVVN
jgi:hypothetical protein